MYKIAGVLIVLLALIMLVMVMLPNMLPAIPPSPPSGNEGTPPGPPPGVDELATTDALPNPDLLATTDTLPPASTAPVVLPARPKSLEAYRERMEPVKPGWSTQALLEVAGAPVSKAKEGSVWVYTYSVPDADNPDRGVSHNYWITVTDGTVTKVKKNTNQWAKKK